MVLGGWHIVCLDVENMYTLHYVHYITSESRIGVAMMAGARTTFWEHVYGLRQEARIPRVWERDHLREFLERPAGPFAPNTIDTLPSNYYISKEGSEMGNSVQKGGAPKVWLVRRGQFRLIADPDDNLETQEAAMRLAKDRAAELRSQKRQSYDPGHEAPMSLTDLPDRHGLQTESGSGNPDLYPSIPIALTPSEHRALTGRLAEQKAMYIVNKHLKDKYGSQAEIEEDQDGADLRVSIDGKTERIEVKGTESPTLAWPELEVSSRKSHEALESGDASMYRVVDVSGANPRIYVLTHGQHFTLEPESRWAVKRVPLGDDRYPLRGQPYRYDLPYDPVAVDEWEVLE